MAEWVIVICDITSQHSTFMSTVMIGEALSGYKLIQVNVRIKFGQLPSVVLCIT